MPKVTMPNLSGLTIDQGRIKFLSQIGRGTFGTVYNALDLTTSPPEMVAIKVVRKAGQNPDAQFREIVLHHTVSGHDNVVTFHRVFHDSAFFYIVLEFHPGGDMWGAIKNGEYWKDDELVRTTFLQLIDAIKYCHSRGIYHRDLKPNNVLVSEDASEVYVSDFGLASRTRHSRSFGVGTAQFRSPECQNAEGHFRSFDAERNDIWALGVIFATVIGGRMPWNTASEKDTNYLRHLRHPHYLRQVLPISKETNYILQRIFNPCTETAPSLDDIREMVVRAGTFFMNDREIKRSKRLRYISAHFDEMRRIAFADSDSDDSDVCSRPLHTQSLAALEEGRAKSGRGTPEAKPFVHGMVPADESPRTSLLESPVVQGPAERPAVPKPSQPLLKAAAPRNGTSSTLITSNFDQPIRKSMLHHRSWLRVSHSVRRLFGAERTR
ncbi:kinase-like domain-containing protein [Cytidiella melzeri]|nr:kinase-like domain-containing protein [Cytidiella melzeri]